MVLKHVHLQFSLADANIRGMNTSVHGEQVTGYGDISIPVTAVVAFIAVAVILWGNGAVSLAAPPSMAGCPILPADSIWNTPVDTLPVDGSSDAYISSIGPDITLHPDFGSPYEDGGQLYPIGIPYNLVPGTQGKVVMHFDYDAESDPGPYPIPPGAVIEGVPDWDPDYSGDRHILVVDTDNCLLYETFDSWPRADGGWDAGSGAVFDLNSHALRTDGYTSADAAGLPILPGLVRYDEVTAGTIEHAIRFTADNDHIRDEHVWPARHDASQNSLPTNPPMGQRFRLKAGVDISGYPEQVQVILRAMKKYGLILADNGADWYISGDSDDRWDNDTLVAQFKKLKGSDFEAVDVSSLMIDLDSGQATQPEGRGKDLSPLLLLLSDDLQP